MSHLIKTGGQILAHPLGRRIGRDEARVFGLDAFEQFVELIVFEIADDGVVLHVVAPFVVEDHAAKLVGNFSGIFGEQGVGRGSKQLFGPLEEEALFVGGVHADSAVFGMDLRKRTAQSFPFRRTTLRRWSF